MKNKEVFLKTLLWGELLVSAAALLIFVFLLVSRYMLQRYQGIQDLALVTLLAFFYFMAAVAWVLKLRSWKLFQYMGFCFTLVVSWALMTKIWTIYGRIPPVYFVPIILSTFMTLTILVTTKTK